MIDFITSVVGEEAIRERFLHVGDSIRDRIRQALGRIGQEVAARARSAAPHKTGALAGSIQPFLVETLTAQKEVIKAGEVYGVFLEHGTVMHGGAHNKNAGKGKRGRLTRLHQLRSQGLWRIQPRPFLSPALASLRDQIDADLAAALSAGVEDGQG